MINIVVQTSKLKTSTLAFRNNSKITVEIYLKQEESKANQVIMIYDASKQTR